MRNYSYEDRWWNGYTQLDRKGKEVYTRTINKEEMITGQKNDNEENLPKNSNSRWFNYAVSSKKNNAELEKEIKEIYGSRKIESGLKKLGKQISRRRICRIMKRLGLVLSYTIAKFKP